MINCKLKSSLIVCSGLTRECHSHGTLFRHLCLQSVWRTRRPKPMRWIWGQSLISSCILAHLHWVQHSCWGRNYTGKGSKLERLLHQSVGWIASKDKALHSSEPACQVCLALLTSSASLLDNRLLAPWSLWIWICGSHLCGLGLKNSSASSRLPSHSDV